MKEFILILWLLSGVLAEAKVTVLQPEKAGTTVTLAHDGDGNRVRKTVNGVSVYYLVEGKNPTGYAQVLEEQAAAGGAASVNCLPGLDLVSQRRGGQTYYCGYDGHGSVRYLANGSGVVTDTASYDAFGNEISATGSTINHYRYAGEQWDADLGLYYLRARYYDPQMGRFLNMDTFEGNQEDPLSLHKYLYTHADPVNRIDPSGRESLLNLSISTSIGTALRFGYDTSATAAGAAIQKTIMGVQAGKTAEAIVLEYTVETVVGAAAGFVLGKVIGRALDLGDAAPSATGLFKNPEPIRLPLGTRVYRVYLPKNPTSQIYGRFWTTVDPRKVANYADAAGLPQHVTVALRNGEAKLLVGRVINNENVLGRAAENIGGNRGGLFEVQFPNAPSQVQVLEEVPF